MKNDLSTEIFSLCKQINENTEHHVTFQYYGHVDIIEIQFYIDGFDVDNNNVHRFKASTKREDEWLLEYGYSTLESVKDFLMQYTV